jgi:hypothetical protein
MRSSPDSTNNPNQSLLVEKDTIESVNKFIYMGTLVNKKYDIISEIKWRTLMANRCDFGLAPLLKSNNLTRNKGENIQNANKTRVNMWLGNVDTE